MSGPDDRVPKQPDANVPVRRPNVSVIVLNWNGKLDTLACLATLAAVTYDSLRVLIVDNGSGDGSEEIIRATYPQFTFLQSGTNRGYAGGNNFGIEYCLQHHDSEFVLLLNNDTVVDPSFMDRLVDAADHMPHGGIFGPKIYCHEPRDQLWFAGGDWNATSAEFVHRGEGERDVGQHDQIAEVEFITGCALLIRTSLLHKLRGFDERYFLIYEDCDLCFRARELGASCIYVPTARIWHRISASLGRGSALSAYFWTRNRLLFARRHLPLGQRMNVMLTALIESCIPSMTLTAACGVPALKRAYWAVRRSGGKPFYGIGNAQHMARLCGIRDFLLYRFGDCPAVLRRR